MFQKTLRHLVIAALASFGFATPIAQAGNNLNGAGSTFVYPVLAKWAESYKAKAGVGVNYQSIGSGGGIKQIKAKTVAFGASDKPLDPKELDAAGLMQFPIVMGGVVPVVNLKGVQPGELKLTGAVLADIYLGKITNWNDAAITKLNPGAKLPADRINVVARADGSGTTYIFTHYLSRVSPEFKGKIGNNTSVEWKAGVGGKGNEGVASYVKQLNGAIGYVEYAYALQNKMTYVQLQNKAGKFVKPDSESFQAAATGADWKGTPGFDLMLTDQPGAKSWPITGATFILLHKTQTKTEAAQQVLTFFDWAYRHGDKLASALDYVPMPDSVVKLIEAAWKQDIKDASGKAVWTDAMIQK